MRLPQDQGISKFYYGHGEACDLIYRFPSKLSSYGSPSQGARMPHPTIWGANGSKFMATEGESLFLGAFQQVVHAPVDDSKHM